MAFVIGIAQLDEVADQIAVVFDDPLAQRLIANQREATALPEAGIGRVNRAVEEVSGRPLEGRQPSRFVEVLASSMPATANWAFSSKPSSRPERRLRSRPVSPG